MEIKDYEGLLEISLVSFETELRKLNKDDSLPRYNKLELTIKNNSSEIVEELILTVIRTGSKIGSDNFDTVPMRTYELKPGQQGRYELMVFDPFNEIFKSIEVRLTTNDDWQKRRKSENWLLKSGQFSKRLEQNLFKRFWSKSS